MTIQNRIEHAVSGAIAGAIAKAIDRAPFTYFDQLIILRGGEVCITEEDDLSGPGVDASDILLHRIAGELSDDDLYDPDNLDADLDPELVWTNELTWH
jgi:hypothetical protein